VSDRVELYGTSYAGLRLSARELVRRETYGEDLGQSSWLTIDEWERFGGWLDLPEDARVLDVACGSGGPILRLARLTGATVVGIDVQPEGIEMALAAAAEQRLSDRATFLVADATDRLPLDDESFDAVTCIDAINHMPGRGAVFDEWHRVLRPEGQALFTDPAVVTGLLTKEDVTIRSSIGEFVFSLLEENARLVREAGFELLRTEDVTENTSAVAKRWHDARDRYRDELVADEGEETFAGIQRFLATAHALARERRLSRFATLARRTAS
jgi:SAM-dependent methyltransferase